MNVLNNAVKFTEKGGIWVKVEVSRQAGETPPLLHFYVADTGIGLAPDRQEQLFKAFHQLDASTTRRFVCVCVCTCACVGACVYLTL